jgi:hypothetical protein
MKAAGPQGGFSPPGECQSYGYGAKGIPTALETEISLRLCPLIG